MKRDREREVKDLKSQNDELKSQNDELKQQLNSMSLIAKNGIQSAYSLR